MDLFVESAAPEVHPAFSASSQQFPYHSKKTAAQDDQNHPGVETEYDERRNSRERD